MRASTRVYCRREARLAWMHIYHQAGTWRYCKDWTHFWRRGI